ncbi:MAG: hypothetical protein K8H90_01805, partial [Thermoanaerobaculia bacterium]|nr:hypothetical protein [Thermoanaerobaculia bacterium]
MTIRLIRRTKAGIAGGVAFLLLLLASATTAQEPAETLEAAPAEEDAAVPDERPAWLSGRLRLEADAAWDDRDSDFDLEQTLHLNVTPPDHPGVRFSGALWLREDLDSGEPGSSALRDINDAYGGDIRARLLHLHAEIDDLWGKSTLRVGRQRILDGPAYNRIDGLYFKQYRAKWDWYVFAGARASLYEDSHNDFAYGGGASYRPGSRTRIALDVYRADEHRDAKDVVRRGLVPRLLGLSFPREVVRELDDTSLSASLWQQLTDNLRFFGRYTYNHDAGDE